MKNPRHRSSNCDQAPGFFASFRMSERQEIWRIRAFLAAVLFAGVTHPTVENFALRFSTRQRAKPLAQIAEVIAVDRWFCAMRVSG